MGCKGLTIEEQDSGAKFFTIGDVHGCKAKLERLLSKLPIRWGKDYLILLGDYIDRGEDPKGVLEIVLTLKEKHPDRIFPLKGNHEAMFEGFWSGLEVEIFFYNGGYQTLRSYLTGGKLVIPEEHKRFIKSLPLYLETPNYIFVHAGINPKKPLLAQDEEDLLWIRQGFYLYAGEFPKTVIFGHTPFPEVLMLKDRIGVDTGCVYGGKLTALKLPEREIYQV